jgi:hypothetical protein
VVGDFCTATTTIVDLAIGSKLFQRFLVDLGTTTLVHHHVIPFESKSLQCGEDVLACAGYGSGLVEVVNTDFPLTVVGSGIEITGKCCDQGAKMQGPGGRGGEAPYVTSRKWLMMRHQRKRGPVGPPRLCHLFFFDFLQGLAVDTEVSSRPGFKALDANLDSALVAVAIIISIYAVECLIDFLDQFAFAVTGT